MLPDFAPHYEGLNGHCMNDDELGEFYYTSNRKPPNHNYYHVLLFEKNEEYKEVHETDKAVLFQVKEGQFWVPKSLIRILNDKIKVHKSFRRLYLKKEEEE